MENLSSVLEGVFRLSMELNPSWKNSFLGEIQLLYIVLKLLVGFIWIPLRTSDFLENWTHNFLEYFFGNIHCLGLLNTRIMFPEVNHFLLGLLFLHEILNVFQLYVL